MRERFSHHASVLLACILSSLAAASGLTVSPSTSWKNRISFPSDSFCARGISKDSAKWVKFSILLSPYDSNVVYFQNSRTYVYHYDFAAAHLDPFLGMTSARFNAVTMFEQNQQAILGSVIVPPTTGTPAVATFNEYGIQFVRQDPYTREQIRDLFNLVKACVSAPSDVRAFYFPTYEQQAVAAVNREWFESQGIPLGSAAQWAPGNACYSQGWALGQLKFFTASDIDNAYQKGLLKPEDILLTDGVPAELPFVAGIVSLAPATPNCHVALLARAYAIPFVYLMLADDTRQANELTGHRVIFSAYLDSYDICSVRLIDADGSLDDATAAGILELKQATPLKISPITPSGTLGVSCDGLTPADSCYVGGKAANFGLLRQAIPDNSPRAIALTFDLWNAFLDQPLQRVPQVNLAPGEHVLIWADGDPSRGPTHTSFKLAKEGECVALFDTDGRTLIDSVTFGPQRTDVSYGRSIDGSGTWQLFSKPTPCCCNSSADPNTCRGLVINELMADNKTTIEDPNRPGHYPDWIELYNASGRVICLSGLYLTDDMNDPTRWRIPPALSGGTLRQEIAGRLSAFPSYPPTDMQGLCSMLASIRSLFTDGGITTFTDDLRTRLWAVLADPDYGLDPNVMLRFRSSTNVEDGEDFIGAGLYDSFSGCLADDLEDTEGACNCDPNESGERGVLLAIRKAFASFYNSNAYLERLRRDVDETQVGMALLVHPSFPDDLELANGVATVEKSTDGAACIITLVSQTGAVSITNPDETAAPEEVTIQVLASGSVVPPKLVSASGLLPLGGTVMTWSTDYKELGTLLLSVSDAFAQTTGKTAYILDMEYKKVAPGNAVLPAGGLVVKQVRQVPEPDQTPSITPYLVDVPTEFEIFPGEFELLGPTDVFADHRQKCRWTLETKNMALDAHGLSVGLYDTVTMEYVDGDQIRTLSTSMSALPLPTHTVYGDSTADSWSLRDLANPGSYRLQTTGIVTAVSAAENPIFIPADLGDYAFNLPFRCLTLNVEYDNPVLSWFQNVWPTDPPSGPATTRSNCVHLWARQAASDEDVYQERSFSSSGISIKVSFYYPPVPTGYPNWSAHTAPLKRWAQTTLEGLTSKPIVLNGYYSRTYRPEHHNLIENFLFEPRLEPDLSSDILDDLQSLDVRLIHLILDNRESGNESQVTTYGFDGAQ
jgi:hypothetical protein